MEVNTKELIEQYNKYLQWHQQTLNRINRTLEKDILFKRKDQCKNTFAKKYARHHFSQADEDGITLEIIKRINGKNKDKKTFLEIGVGNGCENNTLILLSLGWTGTWFGAEKLAFNHRNSKRLKFQEIFITKENIRSLYQESLKQNNSENHSIISVDLDGNDYQIIKSLLEEKADPDLFIIEYNGIFPPEVRWEMPYNPKHIWSGDSYFGASLRSYVDLFNSYGYFLCACNPSTGSNAFFIKSKYRDQFQDVPNSIHDIYIEPNYLLRSQSHWPISPKLITSIIE